MALLEKLRDEDDDELNDETILNVFRREDEKVLKTKEIADELPITQTWTNTRLNELETKGRVHSKSAGRGRVWWLDETETNIPVAEGIGDVMWYSARAERVSETVGVAGIGMFVVGGLLLIPIFLMGVYPSLKNPFVTTQDIATTAMLAAIVASLLLIVGGGLKLLSLSLQRRYTAK